MRTARSEQDRSLGASTIFTSKPLIGFQSPWWCRGASSKAAFVMEVVMMDKWIGAAMISQDIRGKFVVILDGSI